MKKIAVCLILISMLVLSSCKGNNFGGRNSYVYNGEGEHHFINTQAFKDTDFTDIERFNEINSGMTYEQMFNTLGSATDLYLSKNCKVYFLNNNKILSVKYRNITDICNYSGAELLNMAKSYLPPSDIVISGNEPQTDHCFAVILNDNLIFSADNGFSELSLKNAEIIFQDGTSAAEDDLTVNSQVIIYYDEILESYPGVLLCNKIIILN